MFARVKDYIMPKADIQKINNSCKVNLLMFADQVNSMYSWTPDAVQLEKKTHQPIFVYDNLVKGGSEHYLIEGKYLDTDEFGQSHNYVVYTHDRFEMWKAMVGNNTYPLVLKTGSPSVHPIQGKQTLVQKVKSAKIKGKLYKVRSDIIYMLDNLRHNGIMFHRLKINIQVPFRFLNGSGIGMPRLSEEFIEDSRAWMYVADSDYWLPLLDGGHYFTPAELLHIRSTKIPGPVYFFNPNREKLNNK